MVVDSLVVELLRTLSVEIGVRRCGTPEAERAAHAVAGAFAALGLEPRFQEFPLLGYEADEPLLEVDGERWEAGPCMYAHPGEVEGEVRRLSDGIFSVGEEGRLRRSPFGTGAVPFMQSGGYATTPPTAYISPADAARLRDGMHARLVVSGRFVPGLRERNVIAELPGASEETVVVGAHYDSVWRGPGAIDNATGVEGLLQVAARLAGREHPRSLAFVAFGAEEVGLLGAKHYVGEAKARDELGRIVGMVNLDCIGHGESLELLCAPEALLELAKETARGLGLYDRYEVVTELGGEAGTDHLPFAQAGIPAASILHFPYDEYHLPTDTPDLVDPQRLADAVELAVALVERQLANPVERAG
jgi:Iap family predicted aminopeptidase